MLTFKDFEHLFEDKRVRFKTEEVNGQTVTIGCYMVADTNFWKLPLATECRGIVFDAEGGVISRPFHKFFNVGETEETQLNNLTGTYEILEKRDGSLITPVLIGGVIVFKSKKSFYSDVAVEANAKVPKSIYQFSLDFCKAGFTPIFEYTSPNNRVVIDYGVEPEFVLLALRNNTTGDYIPYFKLEGMVKPYGVNLIKRYDLSLNDCLSKVKYLSDFEGWCLRDTGTGFYAKLKTDWYLRNHKARTGLRERDVADMVVEETFDDIKSALNIDGFDITPVEEIERKVVGDLVNLESEVNTLCNKMKSVHTVGGNLDFKAVALAINTNKFFGLVITLLRGKEPDYKKFWKDNLRQNYSLKCLYNENF